MTAGSSIICLQLGSQATISDSSSYSKLIAAKSTEDLVSSKNDLTPSSINQLDVIVHVSELSNLYNPMELASWVPFLKPEAVVSVQVQGTNGNAGADLQPINTSFLLAGLSSSSERREADGSRILTATRKVAPTVSAAPLTRKPVVVLNLGDEDNDDADMIDEDGLLEDTTNLLAPPPAMNTQSAVDGDDCAGRKPCDNCTCGRAEKEAGDAAQTQAPKSSCGKCHLGDAFRCASCPYLGKPAFKPGEEHLVLQLTDDL
jgi:hypothetical protein